VIPLLRTAAEAR